MLLRKKLQLQWVVADAAKTAVAKMGIVKAMHADVKVIHADVKVKIIAILMLDPDADAAIKKMMYFIACRFNLPGNFL